MEMVSREEFTIAIKGMNEKLDMIITNGDKQNGRVFKLEERAGCHEVELAKICATNALGLRVSNRIWAVALTFAIPLMGAIGGIVAHVFWGG